MSDEALIAAYRIVVLDLESRGEGTQASLMCIRLHELLERQRELERPRQWRLTAGICQPVEVRDERE